MYYFLAMPFVRKNVRLAGDNYCGRRSYFVTICCHQRKPLLRESEIASRQVELLSEIAAQLGFAVHAYCFMPDHVHLLLEGLAPESQLLKFVNRLKQRTAFEYRLKRRGTLWQVKFYDHILRRGDAMDGVA